MPGLISTSRAASVGTPASMKRAREDTTSANEQSQAKKRKVEHRLHHTQPVERIVEPLSGSFGVSGDSRFVDHQVRRAIAISCKSIGFDGAEPHAIESFHGLVDRYMNTLLADVRKSMTSGRRTEPTSHDWVFALASSGLKGSSSLESHFDIGEIPPTDLQWPFSPPEPPEAPPPDLEGLLGPELSGKAEKESRKYIPQHFPPFPSKHTYKATPVFPQRENDPRMIRERAAKEGMDAEKSLRTLMAAKKAGLQKRLGGKQKLSSSMKERDWLWEQAMKDALKAEEEQEARRRRHADKDEYEEDVAESKEPERKLNLEERVHVNYDRKFWRKSAREH